MDIVCFHGTTRELANQEITLNWNWEQSRSFNFLGFGIYFYTNDSDGSALSHSQIKDLYDYDYRLSLATIKAKVLDTEEMPMLDFDTKHRQEQFEIVLNAACKKLFNKKPEHLDAENIANMEQWVVGEFLKRFPSYSSKKKKWIADVTKPENRSEAICVCVYDDMCIEKASIELWEAEAV